LSYYCHASNNQHLLARLNFPEPQTYDQAASHPGWQQAMHQELQALEQTKTWEIVPLPPGKRSIACKWV